MIKIAICDDNMKDLSNITTMIDEYNFSQGDLHNIDYSAFQSAADLISTLEYGQKYSIVLLDIIMPLMTGLEAAKKIRQFNQDVKIIFMTSSTEFAVESYSVNAYSYTLKPIGKDNLFHLLDKVISEIEVSVETSFLVKNKFGLTRVSTKDIEFIEVNGRTLVYHFTDGSVLEAVGSMSALEKEILNYACFIKPHRSYIINMEYIDTMNPREIIMRSLTSIPISRANWGNIKSAYISYSFKN